MAAGYAKRMRPLTDNLPKPLLEVGGTPLLTHIIEHLIHVGVTKIIINGYHAIDPLKHYMKRIAERHPDIEFILSEEDELLDTGGGAVKAMQYFSNEPFYMINGDAFWVNPKGQDTLELLSKAFEEFNCDLILLLQSTESMALTGAVGDYHLRNGNAVRAHDKQGDHMFTGIRICHPRILKEYKEEFFSFLKIMDEMDVKKDLYGQSHDGEWYHISTPDDLAEVNQKLFGIPA